MRLPSEMVIAALIMFTFGAVVAVAQHVPDPNPVGAVILFAVGIVVGVGGIVVADWRIRRGRRRGDGG